MCIRSHSVVSYWTQTALSKNVVGTSFMGDLEDRTPTCSPTQRQGDGQVNLWMDWERRVRKQVALPSTRFLRPGEDSSGLIRHFLIESSAKGVHLKGADEEPYFGELSLPSPQAPSRQGGWPGEGG